MIFLGSDERVKEGINDNHGISEKGLAWKAEELKVRLRIGDKAAVMVGVRSFVQSTARAPENKERWIDYSSLEHV